ncbi:hypothetical protein AVEN_114330-1 [Araneus ventricosus]|uniref:Uncharacterized protein n=1 Tax=Araneus ventricosus TaxID=182803 RepID=A0A4Y2RI69_ARAVE|nr:hypothetical protein AVEN_114330-1 [Araneus ventricosus]
MAVIGYIDQIWTWFSLTLNPPYKKCSFPHMYRFIKKKIHESIGVERGLIAENCHINVKRKLVAENCHIDFKGGLVAENCNIDVKRALLRRILLLTSHGNFDAVPNRGCEW